MGQHNGSPKVVTSNSIPINIVSPGTQITFFPRDRTKRGAPGYEMHTTAQWIAHIIRCIMRQPFH